MLHISVKVELDGVGISFSMYRLHPCLNLLHDIQPSQYIVLMEKITVQTCHVRFHSPIRQGTSGLSH